MELFYFQQKDELNNFIQHRSGDAARPGAEFLQSWEWGGIISREGAEILRVGVKRATKRNVSGGQDCEEILAAATLIKKPLAFLGGVYFYWYAPRGPIGTPDAIIFLIEEVKKINRRALFLRMEPESADGLDLRLELELKSESADGSDSESNLKKLLSVARRTKDIQPPKTLILDLNQEEKELLEGMHPKTRYNIRLAEKKGVKIQAGSSADFKEFWRLMNLTGERDQFRLHGAAHYKNLLGGQGGPDAKFIKLFLARYQGRNIAAGLFCFFGHKVTYLHGASDNEFRNVMAPYLLQWTVIKIAQADGYKYYDFYGIDEKKWPGVTRFKLGFGGRPLEFPGTFDFVFRPIFYRLYNGARKLGRLLV